MDPGCNDLVAALLYTFPYRENLTPRSVYLTNSTTPFGVDRYSVDSATGALTFNENTVTGLAPYGVFTDPPKRYLYVVNSGGTSDSVSHYTLDLNDGSIAHGGETGTGGTTPRRGAVDRTGGFLFAANVTGAVSRFAINRASGSLSLLGTTAAGTTPYDLLAHPDLDVLYVANQASNDVSQFTIDGTGTLTMLAANISAGTSSLALAFNASKNVLYVGASGTSTIEVFAADPTTGALSALTSVGTSGSTQCLTLAPDDSFLFETNSGGVTVFALDASGIPSNQGTTAAGGNPGWIDVDESGRFAYVTDQSNGLLYHYRIGAGGVLSPGGSIATTSTSSLGVHVVSFPH